jgi:hypothetical protein
MQHIRPCYLSDYELQMLTVPTILYQLFFNHSPLLLTLHLISVSMLTSITFQIKIWTLVAIICFLRQKISTLIVAHPDNCETLTPNAILFECHLSLIGGLFSPNGVFTGAKHSSIPAKTFISLNRITR